jgi:TRAF3-interacting protein 1
MYTTCTVGALTKNIMAMKERLEGDLPQNEQPGLPIISEAQRRKEREMVTKEVGRERGGRERRGAAAHVIVLFTDFDILPQIEKLQGSIQTLCKSANPLGKIMDYVQVTCT